MAGWKLRKDKTQAEAVPAAEPFAPSDEVSAPPPAAEEPGAAAYGAASYEATSYEWLAPASAWQPSVEDEPVTPQEMEVGGETEADFAADPGLHFDEDADSLVLVDYSEDAPLQALPTFEATPPEALPVPLAFEAAPAFESIPLPPPTFEAAPPKAMPAPPMFEAVPLFEAMPPAFEAIPLPPPALEAAPPMSEAAPAAAEAAPTEAMPAPPVAAGDEFTSTLRMDRADLAGAFAPPAPGGIPVVAPFVLDGPPAAPPAEQTTHRLVLRVGRLSATFDLVKDAVTIGRPDAPSQHYPDVEIELDDAVSRRHAEVVRRDDGYYLVDAGSTNGTMLNGETLPSLGERRLAHGDQIRVGERTEIIFE